MRLQGFVSIIAIVEFLTGWSRTDAERRIVVEVNARPIGCAGL
jgi:hypothetical protein